MSFNYNFNKVLINYFSGYVTKFLRGDVDADNLPIYKVAYLIYECLFC